MWNIFFLSLYTLPKWFFSSFSSFNSLMLMIPSILLLTLCSLLWVQDSYIQVPIWHLQLDALTGISNSHFHNRALEFLKSAIPPYIVLSHCMEPPFLQMLRQKPMSHCLFSFLHTHIQNNQQVLWNYTLKIYPVSKPFYFQYYHYFS